MKGKKLWAIILTVCMIVSTIGVVSVTAEAETDLQFSIVTDKEKLHAGDEVTVTMNLDSFASTLNEEGKCLYQGFDMTGRITTVQFLIPINFNVFEYVSGSMESGLWYLANNKGALVDCNFTDSGLTVALIDTKTSIEEGDTGKMFSFKLKVKDDVSEKVSATFNLDSGAVFKNLYLSTDEVYKYSVNVKNATVEVTDKSVTGIEWATQPAAEIIEGQDLSEALKKAAIKVTYDDGSSDAAVAVTEAMCSGFDSGTVGDQTVTVTMGEQTLTFTITVNAKTLTGITLTGPTKKSYIENQDLDLTGMVVTAAYDNEKTAVISNENVTLSGYDKTSIAAQTITVSYTENGVTKEASFDVTVRAKAPESVAVKTAPTKTTAKIGNDLDLSGGVLEVTYDNGEKAEVDMTNAAVAVSNFDKTQLGEQTVTISYKEGEVTKSATMTVTVLDKEVTKVTLTTAPTDPSVVEGKTLVLKDGKLTVEYDNGTSEEVSLADTGVTITGLDTSTVGVQTVGVSYQGVAADETFDVTVRAKSVDRVVVTTLPAKTSYIENMNDFSSEGGKLTVYYDNDTQKVVNFSDPSVSVTPADTTQIGDQDVTVTYTENEKPYTATYQITVAKKQVAAIAITKRPANVSIIEGQSLDVTDGEITVSYDNKETKTVAMTNEMLVNFDNTKVGTQEVTVSYTEDGNTVTTKLTVEVAAKEVTEAELISAPAATSVKEALEYDLTGGSIRVTYNDGDVQTMPITEAMIDLDTTKTGMQTVTVKYAGKTAGTFEVEVIPKVENGVRATASTELVQGTPLDLTVFVTYDNFTEAELTAEDYEFTGYDAETLGKQTVTVTYKEFETELEVYVLKDSPVDNTLENAPDDTYMIVNESNDQAAIDTATAALGAIDDSYIGFRVYDLELLYKSSGLQVLESVGSMNVTIPLPETMNPQNIIKVYLLDNGQLTELTAKVSEAVSRARVSNYQVTFTTDKIGKIVLAEYVVKQADVETPSGDANTTQNGSDNTTTQTDKNQSVKTGDAAHAAALLAVILAAGIGFVAVSRKRERL